MNEKIQTYSREQLQHLAWISAVECFKIEIHCVNELQKMRPQIEASIAAACEEQDQADDENPDEAAY